MKTVDHPAARVYWQLGQALLPEHFEAQESSLREELALRLRLLPMPFRGVGSLTWDSLLLRLGKLSLLQLTLLLEDGTLVDIPANTDPPASLDLNQGGTTQASVYLHLQRWEAPKRTEDSDASHLDRVERVVQKVVLSTQASSDTAYKSFLLARFKKSNEGVWSMDDQFLPEMLRVGNSPFFAPLLGDIHSTVDTLHEVLLKEIQINHLANKSQSAARECLKGCYRFQALLSNMKGDYAPYAPHPFEFFRALHELYLDVCILREDRPQGGLGLYEHGRLGPCFRALVDQLKSQVEQARTATPYRRFNREGGRRVCELPKEVLKARHVYWLLRKPSVFTQLKLEDVKLASESRLPELHRRATPGIPFDSIGTPPFHHPFDSEVEFYKLSAGTEWDHAVNERRLAFFSRPELEEVEAFLYWRED